MNQITRSRTVRASSCRSRRICSLRVGNLSRRTFAQRFSSGVNNEWFVSATYGARVFMLLLIICSTGIAQMAGDGAKSMGNQPGAPAGSYALSDFEHINLYNGNLNFSLPLVSIGGRGGAKSTINLTIDSARWQLDHDMPSRENLNIQWNHTYQGFLDPNTFLGHYFNCHPEPLRPYDLTLVCDDFPPTEPSPPIDFSIFSEYVGPTGAGGVTLEVFTVDCDRKPGYGPGVLQGQKARMGHYSMMTLTRLTFIAPDGTEYELRDTLTGGKPVTHNATTEVARDRVFRSSGGEGITFVADEPIFDGVPLYHSRCGTMFYPAGYLYFSDGTQYRVNSSGDIELMRDANGNRISYLYDSSHRVTQITDSLNRQVLITYDNPSSLTSETYDDIKYQSDENTWRHVKVYRTTLGNTLRSDFTLSSLSLLFGLPGLPTSNYDPVGLATRVELPDENRNYKLRYNSFGVLARVEVPTGGAIEYDHANPDPWGLTANQPVTLRRVYADGGNTTPDQRQVYSWAKALDSSQRRTASTTVENYARSLTANGLMTEQLQSKEVHSYFGWPDVNRRSFYGFWREGLEFKTEVYAPNSTTPLRRTETEWEQPYPISWFAASQPNQSPELSPNNNPRIKSVTSWLMDVSPFLVKKEIYAYDDSPAFRSFNNKTDVWEYAFGNGEASNQLLRHKQTKYLITDASPTPTPSPSPEPSPTPDECRTCPCVSNCLMRGSSGPPAQEYAKQNLIRLPAEVRVFQGAANNQELLQGRAEYVYDETSLFSRSNVAGWVDPASLARGNLTTTRTWLTPTDENAYVETFSKYDIAGNVIETIDANNADATTPKVTTISYTDCFGSPDGNARSGTAPPSLIQYTYAFPTSVTNAMGYSAYTKYDYYSGSPVTTEDANGVKTNFFYNDPLGRVTQTVHLVGAVLQRQITFAYNDSARTITTMGDLNSFGDNKIKKESLYDKLGRTIETHTYESSNAFITTRQTYDGMGRVIKVTNPYRTTGDSTYGEVTKTYDALGRVIEIKTTSDSATVTTAYAGNTVTVTDQAGKQRKSATDALGRVTSVFEAPNESGFNYETRYLYDSLDNLTKLTQGPQDITNDQTRTFAYDGMSRMISATNPESGTNTYAYDPNGNLLEKADPRLLPGTSTHVKTSYTYDLLNRVVKRSYNDGTPEVNYFYDTQALPSGAPSLPRGASIGQVLAITYGGSTSINGTYFGYDDIGRGIKTAQVTNGQTFPTMEYGYDLSGNMTWQKYPSGREVTTAFDDAGRLSSLIGVRVGESARTYVSQPQYGAQGAITALKLGNGLWERTTFNARLQPIEIKLGSVADQESVLKLSYSYGAADNNGNVRSQTVTVPTIGTTTGFTVTQSYEYDSLNRLKSALELNGSAQSWKQTFSFDHYGNRRFSYTTSATTTPTEPTTSQSIAIYNPEISPANNNRLVGYDYDLAGNVTRDAENRTFAYDAENHQIAYNGGAVINNGDSASYGYDGTNRRVRKQVGGSMVATVFIYNITGQLVAEYSSATSENTGTNYLTSDALGTPRVNTKADGSVKARHDYLPFGEEIAAGVGGRTPQHLYVADGISQKFTSKERDQESARDYFGARYYTSAHGRFASVDPIFVKKQRLTDPQLFNLYVYVRNNPQKYIDPTGEDLTIAITNIVTGTSYITSQLGGRGERQEVSTYRVEIKNESGSVRVLEVTRDTNYAGSGRDDPPSQPRGGYGRNSEVPPGNYRGITRQDGHLGYRIQLYDPNVPQEGATRRNPAGARNTIRTPDGETRTNVQIHIGPGCSQGCVLLQGGAAGQNQFQQTIQELTTMDRRNGFGTDIYVNVWGRNAREGEHDVPGDQLNLPGDSDRDPPFRNIGAENNRRRRRHQND